MQWMKLELRKASNIRKEVDDAIKALNDAVESSDAGTIETLRRSFEQRIQELEEFYLHNDDDDRAVLFEKQRLRLRRALQSAGTTATSPKKAPTRSGAQGAMSLSSETASAKAKSPSESTQQISDEIPSQRSRGSEKTSHAKSSKEVISEPMLPSYSADSFSSPQHYNDEQTNDLTDSNSYVSPPPVPSDISVIPNTIDTQLPMESQTDQTRPPDTPTTSDLASTRAAGDKSTSKSATKKKGVPLYMWEVKEDKRDQVVLASMRPRRQNEHGTFIATSVLGFYQKSPYLNAPDTHVDLQIVVNEDEFASLANRCRTSKAELRHSTRFQASGNDDMNSSTLQASVPYIEPGRVLDNLYRPSQKDKWVGSKDFDLANGKTAK